MARMVLLSSGAWADVALEELAPRAAEWGGQGLELCCWTEHFEIQPALSEADYTQKKLDLLNRNELTAPVLDVRRVGHAVCGPIDGRLQQFLPDYVWGDGDPEGVRQRAAEEMLAAVQAAQKLGVGTLSGFTGATLSALPTFPPYDADAIARALDEFARAWQPILEACREAGIRFAAQVQPGQMAFDLYSAEQVINALEAPAEFGFTLNPAALHWQGVDPVEFVRRFPERIFHVHCQDAAIRLDGRSGLFGPWPAGDARRGWDARAPGHGGVDWESLIRALNDVGYDAALAVDFEDAGMDRDWGGEDACRFIKRLDFTPAPRNAEQAFRPA